MAPLPTHRHNAAGSARLGAGRAAQRLPQPAPEFPGTTLTRPRRTSGRSALLDRYAPAAVLINSKLEVLYASARAERFLRVVGRKSMPKPELRLAARIRSRPARGLLRAPRRPSGG